jgi:hypothetical protein
MTRRNLFAVIAGAFAFSTTGCGSYTKRFLAAHPEVKPFPAGILITGHRPHSGVAAEYLKKIMDEYRMKLVNQPPLTEEQRNRHLSIMEEIWLPRV